MADLAPGLSEGELRLLLELCRRAMGPDVENFTFRASVRDLAESARCSARNLHSCLQKLGSRGVITYHAGTATQATTIKVNVFEIMNAAFEGVAPRATPPNLGCSSQSNTTPTNKVPGDAENMELFDGPRARVELDIDTNDFDVIDRMLKARPEHTDAQDLQSVREWVHGYQCKFGRDPNPHAPDAHILAQLLAIGTPGQLRSLIAELMQERKEAGHSYAWYVTVALQRIHGISYQQARKAREAWKVHHGRSAAAPPSGGGVATTPPAIEGGAPGAPPPTRFDGAAIIANLARRKTL